MALFASVAMSSTKSILPETAKFSAKILHHENICRSSPYNIPNFTNTLAYMIETGYDTFNFKEATMQPSSMDLVE